ncbi:MAG: hypothetical protein ACHP79_12215, partial [Terriglobales bacterium]
MLRPAVRRKALGLLSFALSAAIGQRPRSKSNLGSMDFSSIRLITFDCYGTLIDWETGMLAALRPLFSRDGRQVSDLQLLEHYGEIEAELEA